MNAFNLDTNLPRLLGRSAILGLAIAVTLNVSGCRVAPQPIEMSARRAALPGERAELTRGQEALSAPVTMDEAVRRALKYNLDYRIKLMEEALADRNFDAARMDFLPRMTAAAGYTERNKDNASSSVSVITGRQSLEPSISSERDRRSSDLNVSDPPAYRLVRRPFRADGHPKTTGQCQPAARGAEGRRGLDA